MYPSSIQKVKEQQNQNIGLVVTKLNVPFFQRVNVFFFRELVAELPFTLMHPKPLDDDRPSSSSSHKSESSNTKENGESGSKATEQNVVDNLVDTGTNLIQLDP